MSLPVTITMFTDVCIRAGELSCSQTVGHSHHDCHTVSL